MFITRNFSNFNDLDAPLGTNLKLLAIHLKKRMIV